MSDQLEDPLAEASRQQSLTRTPSICLHPACVLPTLQPDRSPRRIDLHSGGRDHDQHGGHHALLIRRSRSDGELAFYRIWTPAPV
jgi:hypothetical protein